MEDITGKRFGRLTVLGDAPKQEGRSAIHCRCECGTEKTLIKSLVVNGRTRSCGCLLKDVRNEYRKHRGAARLVR